jgi:phospholipid/cholesterol/gamma-HCH transport system ATP-binding protein
MSHVPAIHDSADRPLTPAGDAIISLRSVSKSFGSLHVLRNLNLDIHRGQTTVILGPSGTGKSVLLKHIVGLLRPDSGEVWFEGRRVDHLPERDFVQVRTKFGFLFQMGALFDSMTVGQNVMFPLTEHTNMSLDEQRQRCREVLSLVRLEGTESKMPAELSGGQRKRIALARAIALHPQVVLYDEPTTGLDPIRADDINELILTLQSRLKVTSIVVTHDMHSANRVADRIVMLYDGRTIFDGNPQDIHRSDDPIVQGFVEGRSQLRDTDSTLSKPPTPPSA